jgi:hypothetical protein
VTRDARKQPTTNGDRHDWPGLGAAERNDRVRNVPLLRGRRECCRTPYPSHMSLGGGPEREYVEYDSCVQRLLMPRRFDAPSKRKPGCGADSHVLRDAIVTCRNLQASTKRAFRLQRIKPLLTRLGDAEFSVDYTRAHGLHGEGASI